MDRPRTVNNRPYIPSIAAEKVFPQAHRIRKPTGILTWHGIVVNVLRCKWGKNAQVAHIFPAFALDIPVRGG